MARTTIVGDDHSAPQTSSGVGRFTVDVSTTGRQAPGALAKDATPAQKAAHPENLVYAAAEAEHAPLWAKMARFQLRRVISNYNGERWPRRSAPHSSRTCGVAAASSPHAANNAFPEGPNTR